MKFGFGKSKRARKPITTPRKRGLMFEALESRKVLSAFAVTTLSDRGHGSLRQAILDANNHAGADEIRFNVAGEIRLTSGALPTITDTLDINGGSAPNFAGAPLVEVDFNGFAGLRFNSGAVDSALRSLALTNAGGAGVSVNGGGSMIIVGNYIGIDLDGTTIEANHGNGLELNNTTFNAIVSNLIGGNDANGVVLNNSNTNQIAKNAIGVDNTGTQKRANGQNGILVTNNSNGNVLGKTPLAGSNSQVDPNLRAAEGNLISGNKQNGILINDRSDYNNVSGNLIGVTATATGVLSNSQDGVKVENADYNLVGQEDAVSSISYYNTDDVPTYPVEGWQGIRAADGTDNYYITGTTGASGLLFEGSINGVGSSYLVNMPGAAETTAYGPDNLGNGQLRIVGTYQPGSATTYDVGSYIFEGTTTDLQNGVGSYQSLVVPNAVYTYAHSTANGLVVGNYDSPVDHGSYNLPYGPGRAFVYDSNAGGFLPDLVFPGSISNSAYGIWWNGGTSYTICGGYSNGPAANFDNQAEPLNTAFLVDFDSATGLYSNWAQYTYPGGTGFVTHFQGISSVEKGVYTMSADTFVLGTGDPAVGSWVQVRRNANGSFGEATWVDLHYPGLLPEAAYMTSGDSVYGNQVVGIILGPSLPFCYQATVNIGFQLANIISGNGANGVSLTAADNNVVAMNYIGTDNTGTQDLGNGSNGLLITAGSHNNLIGGEATNGNNPTNGVYATPPQGNLISGNNANGVLINGGANNNQLSGNYIGTAASGLSALGNSGDGVAVVGANSNSLLGTTFLQDPFVFYNVVGGNRGNGLRIKDSNDTTIQANFFGIGSDNNTPVGNLQNGVLVEGSSTRTTLGGPYPLGNVASANGQNGVVVKDSASDFTSYNTFAGIAAFSTNMGLGNAKDGILVTSTGGNIVLRTNVVSRNGDDGIEVSGNARDVWFNGNIVGLDSYGTTSMGNAGNGIEIGGNAHDILIGGPQPHFNLDPVNVVSGNGGNGIAVVGNAHDITISRTHVGTDVFGTVGRANGGNGIYLGSNTFNTIIGSEDLLLPTLVSGNVGNGVFIDGSHDNMVRGTRLGTDSTGAYALGNGANGILIKGSDNSIGNVDGTGATNVIAYNTINAVRVETGDRNGISQNSIYGNGSIGIYLGPNANDNQAAPLLLGVSFPPLGALIGGTINSRPNTWYAVEIYANTSSGAEGRLLLTTQLVLTNSFGFGAFSYLQILLPIGYDYFTATATDPENNTSEFSNSVF